jgi:hypothetical protein
VPELIRNTTIRLVGQASEPASAASLLASTGSTTNGVLGPPAVVTSVRTS